MKNCEKCGKPFRTGPGKNKKYCSRKCYLQVRHDPQVNILQDVDAAYLAGLVDGEGSLTRAKDTDRGRGVWRLSIYNSEQNLVNWCKDVTGVGTVVTITSRQGTKNYHKPERNWRCFSWKAKKVLEQVLPYMRHTEKIERTKRLITELVALGG